MKQLLVLLICSPFILQAQDTGIRFEKDLSWDQVLAKAKTEKKYIFVDCYTTWCGPCKAMDKNVFQNDSVGTFINKNLIAVKVQIDQTEKDDLSVRNWYKDAAYINKQYKVIAYPTHLFFSPEGQLVHKETGLKTIPAFITMAQTAMMPGKVFTDPYAAYDSLVADYKLGKKNYKKMPFMIKTAKDLNDNELTAKLNKDYYHYLVGLKKDQLYTPENITFLADIMSSKNKLFSLFYNNGAKIDAIMHRNEYAKEVVYRVIRDEEVYPFLNNIKGNIVPDWDQLLLTVRKKYSSGYADWAVLDAKVKWYPSRDNAAYINNFIMQIEKYGIDTTNPVMDAHLNNLSCIVLAGSNNVDQLNTAIRWMDGVLRRKCCEPMGLVWDTYANLLYKIGKKEEAIYWEERAIENVKGSALTQLYPEYSATLDKMKRGERTW